MTIMSKLVKCMQNPEYFVFKFILKVYSFAGKTEKMKHTYIQNEIDSKKKKKEEKKDEN